MTRVIHSERSQMTLTSWCIQQRQSGLLHLEIALFPQGFVRIYPEDPHKNLSSEFSGNYTRLMVKSEKLVAALRPDREERFPAALYSLSSLSCAEPLGSFQAGQEGKGGGGGRREDRLRDGLGGSRGTQLWRNRECYIWKEIQMGGNWGEGP